MRSEPGSLLLSQGGRSLEENSRNELYIPVNVPDRQDLIQGFGMKEIAVTAVSALVGLLIIILTYQITGNMAEAILAGASPVVVVMLAVWRDQFDESVIDKLKNILAYYQSQKRYGYFYMDFMEKYLQGLKETENDGE